MNEFRILGTTGDVTICDCCGRTDLKMTVVVEIDGEIAHFGKVCAAHKSHFSAIEISRQAKAADKAAATEARKAREERLDRSKLHPLYVQGIAIRDELIKEFGFWTRCPKDDPRSDWFSLLRQAEEATV